MGIHTWFCKIQKKKTQIKCKQHFATSCNFVQLLRFSTRNRNVHTRFSHACKPLLTNQKKFDFKSKKKIIYILQPYNSIWCCTLLYFLRKMRVNSCFGNLQLLWSYCSSCWYVQIIVFILLYFALLDDGYSKHHNTTNCIWKNIICRHRSSPKSQSRVLSRGHDLQSLACVSLGNVPSSRS